MPKNRDGKLTGGVGDSLWRLPNLLKRKTASRKLKNVLRSVSGENQFLQHSFVGAVHFINSTGLVGLSGQLN